MTVRAIFICRGIRPDEDGSCTEVHLSASTFDDDRPEDHPFWDATPAGDLSLTLTRPGAADLFEVGRVYTLDIAHVEEA